MRSMISPALLFGTGVRRNPRGGVGRLVKPYAALVAIGIVYVTTIQVVQVFAMTIVFLIFRVAMFYLGMLDSALKMLN